MLKTTNGGVVHVLETTLPVNTFNIYPNPANNIITIKGSRNPPDELILTIFNFRGEKLVCNKYKNQNQVTVDVSFLKKGVYLVKIQTRSEFECKKLVIQ